MNNQLFLKILKLNKNQKSYQKNYFIYEKISYNSVEINIK